MKDKNKDIKTFMKFLENRKEVDKVKTTKELDWNLRKTNWLKAIMDLCDQVDEIIVKRFTKAGFHETSKKEPVRLFEEYIGAYDIEIIKCSLTFCPE